MEDARSPRVTKAEHESHLRGVVVGVVVVVLVVVEVSVVDDGPFGRKSTDMKELHFHTIPVSSQQ